VNGLPTRSIPCSDEFVARLVRVFTVERISPDHGVEFGPVLGDEAKRSAPHAGVVDGSDLAECDVPAPATVAEETKQSGHRGRVEGLGEVLALEGFGGGSWKVGFEAPSPRRLGVHLLRAVILRRAVVARSALARAEARGRHASRDGKSRGCGGEGSLPFLLSWRFRGDVVVDPPQSTRAPP
jgi:hypothetical protein